MNDDTDRLRQQGLESMLGFLVTGLSYLLRKHLISDLRRHDLDQGISIEEFPLLARVFERPGLSQSDLNRLTLKDKTTVTRLLASMEKKGLVARTPDPQDRRMRRVQLTENGEKLICAIIPRGMALKRELEDGIPPREMEITLRTIRRLYRRVAEWS